MEQVVSARSWLRLARRSTDVEAEAERSDESEDEGGGHPAHAQRTRTARAILRAYPGAVCRLCYEDGERVVV